MSKNHRTVKFIEDYATKSKGEIFACDGQIASHLVNVAKVAEYVSEETVFPEKEEPVEKATKQSKKK